MTWQTTVLAVLIPPVFDFALAGVAQRVEPA
jgi:hypothetical protein